MSAAAQEMLALRVAAVHEQGIALARAVIDGIEHRPRMYAWHPDALEAQFVMAVEMREKLLGNAIGVESAFNAFVRLLAGGPHNGPLWCLLREHDALDQHARLLGDFGRWVEAGAP